MAASRLLHDAHTSPASTLLALTRKTYLPDPSHFHHGLLASAAVAGENVPGPRGSREVWLPFDYSDLDAAETALLALEYLRASARWFEDAARSSASDGEAERMMSEVASSSRAFADDLERRITDQFGAVRSSERLLQARTKRPDWLVRVGETDYSTEELLEVATSEQEEYYQFFVQQQDEVEDRWVEALFRELAEHARRLVVYLEGERQGVLDRDGA